MERNRNRNRNRTDTTRATRKRGTATAREQQKQPPHEEKRKKRNEPELLSYQELPAFLKHNRHIFSGYRAHYSWKLCMRSLFQLHNETLNIWTHLVAALIFVGMFYPVIQSLKSPTTMDIVLFGVYLGCAAMAMTNSAVFHLFNCSSHVAYKWLAVLDYSGIALLVVGSYLPLIYWGFHCAPFWRDIYMLTISLFGAIGLALSWIPYFSLPHTRFLRTSFYLWFGWFSLIPIGHLIYLDGSFEYVWRVGRVVLLMGIIYSLGAVFYVSQIPERWAPGSFDYTCQSHVIWHILVFMAAFVQLLSLVYCHRILPEHSCPAGFDKSSLANLLVSSLAY
jgi:adiponectin receptor